MSTRTKCGRCVKNKDGICEVKVLFDEFFIAVSRNVNHKCEYFVDKRSKVK